MCLPEMKKQYIRNQSKQGKSGDGTEVEGGESKKTHEGWGLSVLDVSLECVFL